MSRALLLLSLLAIVPAPARAGEHKTLVPMNPELADGPYALDPGARKFQRRLSVSPGFGRMGSGDVFMLRLGYNPNSWLGYEAQIAHTPGDAAHALFNMLSAVVRLPVASRFQPYAVAGYGMMLVFPGRSMNADPATENAFSFGGGLETYVRDDVALRLEMRRLTVLGDDADSRGTAAYDYLEASCGLTFYRTLGD